MQLQTRFDPGLVRGGSKGYRVAGPGRINTGIRKTFLRCKVGTVQYLPAGWQLFQNPTPDSGYFFYLVAYLSSYQEKAIKALYELA